MKFNGLFQGVFELFGSRQDFYRTEGDRLRDAGELRAAAAAYERHLRRNPGDFDIWVQRGNCLKDVADYSRALAAYQEAIRLKPLDSDVHLQRGHLAKLMGEQDEAWRFYSKSLSLDPDNSNAQHELLCLQRSSSRLRSLQGGQHGEAAEFAFVLPGFFRDARGAVLQERFFALKTRLVKR